MEISREEIVKRFTGHLLAMDGKSLADLYNKEFDTNVKYLGMDYYSEEDSYEIIDIEFCSECEQELRSVMLDTDGTNLEEIFGCVNPDCCKSILANV